MPRPRTVPPLLLLLLLLLVAVFATSEVPTSDGGQVYIVYLGHLPSTDADASEPGGFSAVEFAHHGLLNQVLDDGSSASDRILRSYKRSLNGFAAKLSEEEAHKLSGMNGVVSVFPSKTLRPLTTRSWDFLGFPQTPKEELQLEGDVIVGMLDTGVWPDSPSFSDEGFGPPPSRWKGTCHNFTCNNKIIGARSYDLTGSSSESSPLDDAGHGSHTASTVAGMAVANVSFYGLAAGTARGAVPGARLAIYKVCQGEGCSDADILAGFDDAIADGVDVISFSIGSSSPSDYFSDAQAIGSFHAMRRGVLTSAAAGNSGLDGGYVCNVAPWMLSVAASSIDRQFIDKIVLGNGQTIAGSSINTFATITNATLAFPANGSCDPESLVGGTYSYKGKIVLCPPQEGHLNDGSGPLLAGAAGAILVTRAPDVAFTLPLPGLMVTQDNFDQIMAYVNSTSNPVGTIDRTETTTNTQAPVPASFSSPGPNLITTGILKPDLSAPGVDIIASWSPLSSPSDNPNDTRKVQYNIISGTSMACPHASGAAAYVKSFHRDWSPAMIMSALITTATPMDTPGNSNATALKYGAGQLNPTKAHDPGLVYDALEGDYVAMLCAAGYTQKQLALITGSNTTACANSSTTTSPGLAASGGDLNYPTMAASVEPWSNFTVAFPRTVTNVGAAAAVVYDSNVEAADELVVDVSPTRLEFSAQNQKVSFTVIVSGVAMAEGEVRSAAVVWSSNEHEVRSPVVVYAATDDDDDAQQRA
ncbi:subtilisin-like protease SBT4.3 [Zea mays]|uniref:subtilisin-like protease SBT4.3 n=1 Tax=Zea mays TaxID=4577 RepID=UPI0004DE849B|nr:subtilisin-like protease SBT4.3 [Zea mays]|eukprot:XP_008653653.1 subtilisin-like protease SBT4.3 [Zea mays]